MGEYLLPYRGPPAPPDPPGHEDANPWSPFHSRLQFDFAHFHFVEEQSSARSIDKALDFWAASITNFGGDAPWKNHRELYASIDAIKISHSPWKTYSIHYQGPLPPGTPPKWMTETYQLCTRDARQILHHQLGTTDFKDKINLSPYRQFDGKVDRDRE
jgi:hypothetical protein